MDALQECLSLFTSGPGLVVGNLAIALFCGFLISLLYRRTYSGPSYSATFASLLAALSMITALIIMVIGNNLARAFGLVGALSIIRFRTAIKDMQDIVFIFFSLAVGMAAGVGLHLSAIVGTLFIGLAILVLLRTSYASLGKREYLLQFTFSPPGEQKTPYTPLMEKYCQRHELVNLKSIGDGAGLELSFYIRLKNRDEGGQFTRELGRVPGVGHVNLFFDEEPF